MLNHKFRLTTCLTVAVVAVFLAVQTAAADEKAIETFLVWPDTPPGARDGDEQKAKDLTEAIESGEYKIPPRNRRGTAVPTVDVYLPEKDKATGIGVVIYPGGGYWLTSGVEGKGTARWLNDNGIAAFVCSYRHNPYRHPIPFWDAQRAIRLVRGRAAEFGIKPDKLGVLGCSAGGHLTSTLSVHHKETFDRKPIDKIDQISARPDFSVLIYPVISMRKEFTHGGSRKNLLGDEPDEELVAKLSNDEQVDVATPPAYLVHSKADPAVKYTNSERYHAALQAKDIATECVLLETGTHGPTIKEDGTPIIRQSKEEYAEGLIKWIKGIVEQ